MKKIVATDQAPAAIGPYSQGVDVACGRMIFCSGQIPLDPSTMELVGETASEQCEQVMSNLKNLLAAAGAEFSDVVKTTIFLTDMNDFGEVNEVYGKWFPNNPPARACVEVSRLPKDVKVEIEMIAMK